MLCGRRASPSRADITEVNIRNAVELNFESVTNSEKNEPSEPLAFYEKNVCKEDRARGVGKEPRRIFS